MYYRLNETEARKVMEMADWVADLHGRKFRSHPDVHYIGVGEESVYVNVYMLNFKLNRWCLLQCINDTWMMTRIGGMDDLNNYRTLLQEDVKSELAFIIADYKQNNGTFTYPFTGGVHPSVTKLIADFETYAKLRVRITQKVPKVVGDYTKVVTRLPNSNSCYGNFMKKYQTQLNLENGELEMYYPKEDRWIGSWSGVSWAQDMFCIYMRELRIR